MHIERAHERRTLTGVVVETQKLEAGVMRRAQMALRLIFVGQELEASAGHEELARLRGHTVGRKKVAEDVEIAGTIDTGVLRRLTEIGESAPLPLLVRNHGRAIGQRVGVMPGKENLAPVVVERRGPAAVPGETARTAFDVKLRPVVPLPSAADGGHSVEA